MMQQQELPCILCFNKTDLITAEEREKIRRIYEPGGYRILFTSTKDGTGLSELRALLQGRTTTVAGPSGVGKSSLINLLQPKVQMETGEISKKIERGRHTTRHSELIRIAEQTYIMDTPGFSSLSLFNLEKEQLCSFYPEFEQYAHACRFQGCVHVQEPDCAVKEALSEGKIDPIRYENYKLLYEELKEQKGYRKG